MRQPAHGLQAIIQKNEHWLHRLFLVAFFGLSCLHIYTGYADNGDFWRSTSFLIDKPVGFLSNWPESETAEWKRRFFFEWHDRWVFASEWFQSGFFSLSFYKLYLLMQAGVSMLLSGDSTQYSVILGSLPSRVLVFASFVALAAWIRARHGALAGWGFALPAAAVLLDSGWMAFLNSFYEEQIAVVLLPVLALLMLRFLERRTVRSACLLLACAALMGATKTAYFYLPLLVFLFIFPWLHKPRGWVFAAMCAGQFLAFAPVALGKYAGINAYHSVYFGALKVLPPQERAAMQSLGRKPVLQECIGISAFEPSGPACLQNAHVRHGDFVSLLVRNPSIAYSMLGVALQEGRHAIDGLGKGMRNAPQFAQLGIFNLLPPLFMRGFNVFVLGLLAALACVAIVRACLGKSLEPLLMAGIFLALFGWSQYAMALGDGFFEIRKHLVIGNYALALAFPFMAAACFSMAKRRKC